MTMQGSFSYKNDKSFKKSLENGLFLKIEKIDQNNAWLFFENEQGNKLEIPQGVILLNITDEGFVSQPDYERYLILWSCNYRLIKNGEIWVRISNQRQQSIQISDPENPTPKKALKPNAKNNEKITPSPRNAEKPDADVKITEVENGISDIKIVD